MNNNNSSLSTEHNQIPYSENTPPIDPNIQIEEKMKNKYMKKNLKKEAVNLSIRKEVISTAYDPPVKVVVRIRPANTHEREGDRVVKKVSADCVAVGDRTLTFDSVLDSKSNQEDVFQLVGVPSVKNALAGYNTSILAYGQTGSGKTYTMWGPPSAMIDCQAADSDQGIVPRIFQMLFSEIQREQDNSDGKQINYQCRCSFLEIYNEQIGDLLDPSLRNLEIKDDAKHGFYVENLSEEYVTSYEDITQLLIKGLSSRKVGATTTNLKSSRSHIVFTCIIDSWCKGMSSNCFGSSKTSRISLVDLAGLEGYELKDVERQRVKEEKNVKKSLSRLGHLVNILGEGTPSSKPEDFFYGRSKLTHLLKESLGGNAKLAVICSICPDNKSSYGTLSTLRFGQRVKSIQNEPIINEISEDDVNDLSDQIRQLKDELIKAKSNGCHSTTSKHGYSDGRSVRGSLNLLRLSLNRSLILPHVENRSNEDGNTNAKDVQQLRLQLESIGDELEADLASEQYGSCMEESEMDVHESEIDEIILGKSQTEQQQECPEIRGNNMSISLSHYSPRLQDPTISESPKIGNKSRKSVTFASSHLESHNVVSESSNLEMNLIRQSRKRSDLIKSSLQLSKGFSSPTESLAASLQRGLQIIDSHQRLNSDSVDKAFSFEHLALKPGLTVNKANASVQTLPEETSASSLCSSCRQARKFSGPTEAEDSKKTSDSVDKAFSFEHLALKPGLTVNKANASVQTLPEETSASSLCSSCRQARKFSGPTEAEDSKKTSDSVDKAFSFEHLALKPGLTVNKANASVQTLPEETSASSLCSSCRQARKFSGPTEAEDSKKTSDSVDKAFSFEHLALKPGLTVNKANASVQTLPEETSASSLCSSCRQARKFSGPTEAEDSLKNWMVAVDEAGKSNKSVAELPKNIGQELAEAIKREKELQKICQEQAVKIVQLNTMVADYKEKNFLAGSNEQDPTEEGRKLLRFNDKEYDEQKTMKDDNFDIKEVMEVREGGNKEASFDANEKEALLNEIETLKSKLQSVTNVPSKISRNELRSSLLSKSIQLRKSLTYAQCNNEEELEKERQKWMEMESNWISLTDDLRIDLESVRQRVEKVEMELRLEKKCTEELDDALHRSVLGHARMVEHYADLQEMYNELAEKHKLVMQGVAEIKKAASKAGAKGCGSRFAKSMAAELSSLRVERAREMELLKKENTRLKIQVRDTAEAVHAAGELLVRLREAEEAASVAEENATRVHEENEKLRKQVEKQKRKHKMEITTMKQYLAESRLPESALRPLYRNNSSDMDGKSNDKLVDDDEAWRAEFGAIYQDHY